MFLPPHPHLQHLRAGRAPACPLSFPVRHASKVVFVRFDKRNTSVYFHVAFISWQVTSLIEYSRKTEVLGSRTRHPGTGRPGARGSPSDGARTLLGLLIRAPCSKLQRLGSSMNFSDSNAGNPDQAETHALMQLDALPHRSGCGGHLDISPRCTCSCAGLGLPWWGTLAMLWLVKWLQSALTGLQAQEEISLYRDDAAWSFLTRSGSKANVRKCSPTPGSSDLWMSLL